MIRGCRQLALLLSLLVAVGARAIIPLGYMPGNLLAGEVMTLCPVASAATFAGLARESDHGHHGHLGHQGNNEDTAAFDAEKQCPIGSALSPAVPASTIAFNLVFPQAVAPVPPRAALQRVFRGAFSFRSRAPPAFAG